MGVWGGGVGNGTGVDFSGPKAITYVNTNKNIISITGQAMQPNYNESYCKNITR